MRMYNLSACAYIKVSKDVNREGAVCTSHMLGEFSEGSLLEDLHHDATVSEWRQTMGRDRWYL